MPISSKKKYICNSNNQYILFQVIEKTTFHVQTVQRQLIIQICAMRQFVAPVNIGNKWSLLFDKKEQLTKSLSRN